MSRKKRPPEHASHERWLVSYADFITLLFAFFVVLYASSQVDKKKMGQLSSAIQQAFHEMGVFSGKSVNPPIENELDEAQRKAAAEFARLRNENDAEPQMSRADLPGLKRELEIALEKEIKRNEVALHVGPDGLVVSLREIGFFNSGSSALRPQSEEAFRRIALLLLQYDYSLRVEGHTDNIPIHTSEFASNWELSTARSTEVIRKFIVQYGYPPERLSAAGYAEYHPAANNDTEDGRRTNRRIDIVILGPPKRGGKEPFRGNTTDRSADKVDLPPSR
jgi:chemotaxis protein MotB